MPSFVRFILGVTMLAALLGVSGCGSSGSAQVEGELLLTENRLRQLESALNAGSLRNATLIKQYADILQDRRPELAPLLRQLRKETGVESPIYKSLNERFQRVRDGSETFENWTDKVAELQSIQSGAETSVYNDALSDTVNVIADMSDGELARVNAVSQEQEQKLNNSKSYGAGSQYVGNPHYGHWSHGSGGSFWAWYGQYAFFSSMFGSNRYYYNDWSRGRGYSYYHDVGRNSYTSRSQRSAMADVDRRAQKQFRSSGRYQSPYSKQRSGASGLSARSTAQSKSVFKSKYASSGSSSRYSSSYSSGGRNSSGRTSRGVSRGK